jgi:glucose-1-phosphate thymidylyltransferase
MKGIILAGGSGTRLYPLTRSVSKQQLPIYDKPMIYYPLSTLMLAGVRDILIISNREDIPLFQRLLGDGNDIGINLSYAIQEQPNGLAESFIIGEEFIGKDRVALILGDNIFFGEDFAKIINQATQFKEGGLIFGYYVNNPSAFGVLEFDDNHQVLSIEEKPQHPKSHYIVPGLYFYDNSVIEIAKSLIPSERGELEITDVNKAYLKRGTLNVELLSRGIAWLDTGTHESLLDASNYVETIQKRQGLYIACIEEIAYNKGYINKDKLLSLAQPLLKTGYGRYLCELASGL